MAHDCHVHDLVEVLGLLGSQLFLHVLDRGDLSVCPYRHVHDLLESLLLHSFLQRLDLLSGCCAVGVCVARIRAVWLQLVKELALSWRCPNQPSPG